MFTLISLATNQYAHIVIRNDIYSDAGSGELKMKFESRTLSFPIRKMRSLILLVSSCSW